MEHLENHFSSSGKCNTEAGMVMYIIIVIEWACNTTNQLEKIEENTCSPGNP